MRLTLQALFAVILIAAVSSGAVQKSRLKEYGHQMVGGQALARSAGSATLGQIRNHPHEWGGGAGGYAKRFGSSMGHHIVKGTIQMGVGAWHHEVVDPGGDEECAQRARRASHAPRSARPVISPGCGMPSSASTVGATSARMPCARSCTPLIVTISGTGLSECAVLGLPSGSSM